MYIDPFWCGVFATIITEVIFVIAACFVVGLKKGDK
ncbi:Uncharacterised protein [uncultured Eubacterium sp.]|nr:Uncharacterised protein [uncultured Eubacterium sp.]